MLSTTAFVRQSLDIHLFFARIMKEHSFFLEIGFTPRDTSFTQQADAFRKAFDQLLGDVVSLANGVASPEVLQSGEVVTPYTLQAETVSSYFTSIQIATELTRAETGLAGGGMTAADPLLEQRVTMLNQRAMYLLTGLIEFKTTILANVLSCKMFTVNYPLLIDHILREAKLYLQIIQSIQNREQVKMEQEALDQEPFWNSIMAEHAKFIRGLLDPTEEELIRIANDFGNEFDQLTKEAKAALDITAPLAKVTEASLKATREIRDFKAQGTQGLIECKIKSIIIPLLADHTLREANHYLRLLKILESEASDAE